MGTARGGYNLQEEDSPLTVITRVSRPEQTLFTGAGYKFNKSKVSTVIQIEDTLCFFKGHTATIFHSTQVCCYC